MTVALALVAGLLIGGALGALGGGGSILAVPALVYLLDQSPTQATTGSLVVVGAAALLGAATAHRQGRVLVARGLAFGGVATGGAVAGAHLAADINEDLLLAAFAGLMVMVGVSMALRLATPREHAHHPEIDSPIISFSPRFTCACPRALKILVTATAVGLLTGFLGVGGGFLVVPALVLGLGLPIAYAAGTSLVVIVVTSAAALVTRIGAGVAPDWGPVAILTVTAAATAVVGARLAPTIDPRRLTAAFTTVVLSVAAFTSFHALPALF